MGKLDALIHVMRHRNDPEMRYWLAERFARRISPEAVLYERARLWTTDAEFRSTHRRFARGELRTRNMDRAFAIGQLARHAAFLPGDTAECGVFTGLGSYMICRAIAGTGKRHHAFDSFAGLSQPGPLDGDYWEPGSLAASEEEVRANLGEFPFVEYHAGWIPERFSDVEGRAFSLVHIDVDLYEPTRDSVAFFYPRLVPGGILILDDYGYSTSTGARAAVDEILSGESVAIIDLPTGQGLVIKPCAR